MVLMESHFPEIQLFKKNYSEIQNLTTSQKNFREKSINLPKIVATLGKVSSEQTSSGI